MIVRRFCALALAGGLALTGASVAHAQSFGGLAKGAEQGALQGALGQTGLGGTTTSGTSGLLGSVGLPSLSSASTGNVTGILSYCVQNNIVSGSTATSTLNSLTGKSNVTSDTSYTAGQQGLLQVGNGNQLSLASLKEGVRKKLCNAVLSKSQSLI
ncbi:DUF2501 domain-containing protein [Acetobacter fallax]|uniref:DUF2501 domain-containing protein n=1 Tax=Acetobacter fallax TaxID=1737473 RepID=A0ABX0KBG8_9PROT|nr:DUF2501 domain-containing protein [Acetobacter fallax]NHO32541.1 DUF2501 domain-containing protein [Acetobacter fallax]NHO36114.1 DUF2501 domain-containing protein [Acetobacter fallax]